jgi:hypothetical protein
LSWLKAGTVQKKKEVAIAMQWHGKHVSATIEELLEVMSTNVIHAKAIHRLLISLGLFLFHLLS